MRNMKRLAALALALAMCVPASAFAAETAGGEGVSSVSSPGTGSAPVELTADASNMDVTVPTGVAIYIHADGMVSTPEEPAYITNNGPGPVRVAGISASAVGGWELVDWDADMPIGSKKLALKVAQTAFAADGSYDMEYMNGWWDGCNPMAGNGGRIEQVWEAQASLQKTAVAVTEVAKVVYTLAADKVEATGFSTDAEVFYNAPGDKIGHFIGDPGEVTVSIAGLSSSQFSWTLGSEESWGTDLFLTIDADAAKENLVSPFGVTVSWTGNGGGSATVQVSNNVYNPHVHNWATAWSSDAQYHWHNCLADGCPIGDKFGKDGMGSHVAVTDAAVAPTLTTTGLTEGSHCKTCGYVIKAQTVVPKLDKPASLSFTVSTGGVSVNGSMSNVYGWNYAGVATFSNHPAADTSTTHTVVFRPEAFPKGFLITSVVAQRKDSSNIKVEYSNNGDGTWIGSHGHYMGASTEIYGYNWTYVVTLEKKIDVPLTGLQVELPGDYLTVGETKTLSIKKIPENTTDENPIIVEYAGHLDANRLEVSESGQIKAITRGTTDVLIRCGDYYMYYNIPVLDSEYPDLDLVWNIGGQHFMTKLDSSVNGTFYNIPIVDGKVYVKLCNKPYDLWCTGLPKESCGYIVLTNGGSGTGYAPDVVSSALNYLSDGVYITGFSPDKTFVDVYVRFSCSTNP